MKAHRTHKVAYIEARELRNDRYFKSTSMRELVDELYHVANKIVKNVGESTIVSTSVTGEEYVRFAIYFTDKNKALPIWIKWINAYKEFAKYKFPSYENKIYNGHPLTIYWRTPPNIREHGDKPGTYILCARLLISCCGETTSLSQHL